MGTIEWRQHFQYYILLDNKAFSIAPCIYLGQNGGENEVRLNFFFTENGICITTTATNIQYLLKRKWGKNEYFWRNAHVYKGAFCDQYISEKLG